MSKLMPMSFRVDLGSIRRKTNGQIKFFHLRRGDRRGETTDVGSQRDCWGADSARCSKKVGHNGLQRNALGLRDFGLERGTARRILVRILQAMRCCRKTCGRADISLSMFAFVSYFQVK